MTLARSRAASKPEIPWPSMSPARLGVAETGSLSSSPAKSRRVASKPQAPFAYRGTAPLHYCVHRVRNMETERIGMREFRENLAGYLESGKPLAITRHGETLGFYIPAQKRSRKAEVEAMRAAAKELDAMIAGWGASEDKLMQEYKEIRRASPEKN